MGHVNVKQLVDIRRGLLDRRIFADPEMYRLEQDRIFARCWLFLGHDSELPSSGDFVTRYMGETPVIVCRGPHGELRAFLNMCRHRGNRVCRMDAGNTETFTCAYHGWTFSNEGKLLGMPWREQYGEMKLEDWPLVPVAQIDSYKGLIFATFDPEAPSLREYLGDAAFYLDYLLDRRAGGTEVVGPHRWIVSANWKTAAENFGGDAYHIASTHASGRQMGIDTTNAYVRQRGEGWQIHAGQGHILAAWVQPSEGGGPWFAQPVTEVEQYLREHSQEVIDRLGEDRSHLISPIAGTIFPNLSIHWLTCSLRVWQPRGPDKMEIWSWAILDQAASVEIKEIVRQASLYRFSPTGVFDADDMDNWAQVTSIARSVVGQRYPANYQMNASQQISRHPALKGWLANIWSDSNQLDLYWRWATLLESESWAEAQRQPQWTDLAPKADEAPAYA